MPSRNNGKRVIFFGSFDPLHDGHKHAFAQAKLLGGSLTVVVARDSAIMRDKRRKAYVSEQQRLAAVASEPSVDFAILGDFDPTSYAILKTIPFEILAIGYDQGPSDEDARRILDRNGLQDAEIVRLSAHKPELYKSSFFRKE